MYGKGLHLKVEGTGIYVPERIIGNSDFFEKLPLLNKYNPHMEIIETYYGQNSRQLELFGPEKQITSDRILEVTGVVERRMAAPDEYAWDLGYKAAVNALSDANLEMRNGEIKYGENRLEGIIVATLSDSRNVASVATRIAAKLGVRDCFAYDVNNACAGFCEALNQANARVLRRKGIYLVIATECLTKMMDYSDLNSTLFGDGAGAVVLTPAFGEVGILPGEYSKSDTLDGNVDAIYRDSSAYLRMNDGSKVMKSAVGGMLDSVRVIKDILKLGRADVYIPHQANGRIIEAIRKRVLDEGSVVYENIGYYGNMSAATCAVALHEARKEGVIKSSARKDGKTILGSKVIITGFGAGFVCAATAIQF